MSSSQHTSPNSPSTSSSRPSPVTASSTGVQLVHDANFLIQTYIPAPSDAEAPPYRRDDIPQLLPLCIPRISVSANPASAFARGYNPALNTVGITQEMFLSFIDGLNLAIVASPPLRIVNVVGQLVGFVPNHWTQLASIIVTTSAQVGMRVLSKTLTDRYLRAANLNVFKPRGLSVRLCTTPAMLRLVAPPGSHTTDDESKTRATINKIGRGVGTIFLKVPLPIIGPIAARVIHSLADKPPPIAPTGYPGDPVNAPVLMRRLALLEHTFPGATLPVVTQGLPPPAKANGVMEMINSWGLKFDEKRENKAERKNEERRRAWAQIQAAGSNVGYMDYRDARRAGRRAAKAERKAYRRMQKGQRKGLLSGMSRAERRATAADLLEHWATNRVLWVVVMPAEKDEAIADIQIAEDLANEEQVDEETWKMAMRLEKDQMEDEIESEEEWEEELANETQHASTSHLSPPKSA
ncbi:hypothetical protein EV368DRAFT_42600 [Lentinula lateritia]|nr:hypothetical protein EV368DRAFT_42600 [Lentinula lateritia]